MSAGPIASSRRASGKRSGERSCLKCHNPEGEASDSDFAPTAQDEPGWMEQDLRVFRTMAKAKHGDQYRLLLKATGGLDHGGGRVLKPDSTGYQILERFARRADGIGDRPIPPTPRTSTSAAVLPKRHHALARAIGERATLSLVGRLPSKEELAALKQDGLGAMGPILDRIMREDAFYTRLKEGFNDVFLILGIEDNAETLLSYEHFEHTRGWTEKHDLNHVPEAERQRARWSWWSSIARRCSPTPGIDRLGPGTK